MATVHFDSVAEDDLAAIATYIGVEKQDPQAAHRFVADFNAKCESYAHQPDMGNPEPGLGEDLRSFTFKKHYVVIYRPLDDGIDVLRVVHGARDYARLFRHPSP